MTDTRHGVVIQPLPLNEGGGYLAAIPEMPGCIGDGDTMEAALADVLKAKIEWLAAMKQRRAPGEKWPK